MLPKIYRERCSFVARFSVPRHASLIDKDEASPNTLSIRRFSHSSLYTYPKLITFTHLPVLVRHDQTHPLLVQGAPEIYCTHSEHSRRLLQLSRLTYDELRLGNGGPRDASSARKGPACSDSFASILYASERLAK